MANKISKAYQLSPMSAFFIPQSLQIGIDFLSLQRQVAAYSWQDAWLSILISGLSTLGAMWIILRLLENERAYGRTDVFSIHRRVFGKWVGGALNFVLLGHVMFYSVSLLRSYAEVFQVWLFPQLSTLVFAVIICLLVWYIVIGGIRNIGGICLLSFIYLIPLFQSLIFTVPYARFSNLLPMFDHSPVSILESCYFGAKSYLCFEFIIYFYPFISQPEKAKKWAFLGVLTTVFLFLNITIIGTVFFTQGALQNTIWPLMSLLKTLQIPFFNHAEKIACVFLIWSLVPNICLGVWIVTRGIKFSFPVIKQKYTLIIVLILCVALTSFISNGNQIRIINQLYGIIGVIIVYGYLPILLFCQWLYRKVRRPAV